jgi:hypothetical protein
VPGEHDLKTLLRGMRPEIQDGTFVFCSMSRDQSLPAAIEPLLIFHEQEGTTVVIRRNEAERLGLPFQFPSRLIALTVHSSLDAVGFLAAIATRLAQAGISVNAVSAYYHDHLFVPEHRADEALRLLRAMGDPMRD